MLHTSLVDFEKADSKIGDFYRAFSTRKTASSTASKASDCRCTTSTTKINTEPAVEVEHKTVENEKVSIAELASDRLGTNIGKLRHTSLQIGVEGNWEEDNKTEDNWVGDEELYQKFHVLPCAI